MGLSTLTTIAGRFTTEEEFKKYETFLNGAKTQLGDSHTSLTASMTDARKKNLEWDEKYMAEFMEHLTKLKNSAPVKTISIFASVVALATLFLFN